MLSSCASQLNFILDSTTWYVNIVCYSIIILVSNSFNVYTVNYK